MYFISPFFPLDKKSGHSAKYVLIRILKFDFEMKYLHAQADKLT